VKKNARIQADGHRSFPTLETKGYKVEAKKYDVKERSRTPEMDAHHHFKF
jgi:hypothetical protein